MYLQHFGLKHDPLGKNIRKLASNHQYLKLKPELECLLDTRGIGLITGESGVGKTAGIREWVNTLNPFLFSITEQILFVITDNICNFVASNVKQILECQK